MNEGLKIYFLDLDTLQDALRENELLREDSSSDWRERVTRRFVRKIAGRGCEPIGVVLAYQVAAKEVYEELDLVGQLALDAHGGNDTMPFPEIIAALTQNKTATAEAERFWKSLNSQSSQE